MQAHRVRPCNEPRRSQAEASARKVELLKRKATEELEQAWAAEHPTLEPEQVTVDVQELNPGGWLNVRYHAGTVARPVSMHVTDVEFQPEGGSSAARMYTVEDNTGATRLLTEPELLAEVQEFRMKTSEAEELASPEGDIARDDSPGWLDQDEEEAADGTGLDSDDEIEDEEKLSEAEAARLYNLPLYDGAKTGITVGNAVANVLLVKSDHSLSEAAVLAILRFLEAILPPLDMEDPTSSVLPRSYAQCSAIMDYVEDVSLNAFSKSAQGRNIMEAARKAYREKGADFAIILDLGADDRRGSNSNIEISVVVPGPHEPENTSVFLARTMEVMAKSAEKPLRMQRKLQGEEAGTTPETIKDALNARAPDSQQRIRSINVFSKATMAEDPDNAGLSLDWCLKAVQDSTQHGVLRKAGFHISVNDGDFLCVDVIIRLDIDIVGPQETGASSVLTGTSGAPSMSVYTKKTTRLIPSGAMYLMIESFNTIYGRDPRTGARFLHKEASARMRARVAILFMRRYKEVFLARFGGKPAEHMQPLVMRYVNELAQNVRSNLNQADRAHKKVHPDDASSSAPARLKAIAIA
eukprot:jgi/Tetstr1/448328/TSEL_035612.t1